MTLFFINLYPQHILVVRDLVHSMAIHMVSVTFNINKKLGSKQNI